VLGVLWVAFLKRILEVVSTSKTTQEERHHREHLQRCAISN
jgi:hypothetical protein